MLKRIKKLEESNRATVESSLQDIRVLLKSPTFSKDQAFDYLLSLRMVAKETNNPKAGFFEAVLRAMTEKSKAPDLQFKRYLEVLLGDKDQEKVLEMMSKVDKSMKASRAIPAFPPGRGRGRPYRPVQCFNCQEMGHYQRYCPMRRQMSRGPYARRRGSSSTNPNQERN